MLNFTHKLSDLTGFVDDLLFPFLVLFGMNENLFPENFDQRHLEKFYQVSLVRVLANLLVKFRKVVVSFDCDLQALLFEALCSRNAVRFLYEKEKFRLVFIVEGLIHAGNVHS